VADTDPTNALSYLRIESISNLPPVSVQFLSSTNRRYTLWRADELVDTNSFTSVPGQVDVRGNGGAQTLRDTNTAASAFYRVGVRVP